jgi:hypothetical protein
MALCKSDGFSKMPILRRALSAGHLNPLHLKAPQFFLFLIFASSVTMSFGQNFEGKVTYANSYTSKMPNVSDEMFSSMMGTTQEYLMKGADYKSSTNGTFFQWQLYLSKDNKLYNKVSNSPTIGWIDGAVNTDEVIKSEVNKNVLEVLGYKCDELILTCKSGVQKYYFNRTFKLDPKLHEQHKFGNWSEYLSRAHALPLKVIIDNPQFTLESTATEVKPMKVDEKIFELPKDSKVEKSTY